MVVVLSGTLRTQTGQSAVSQAAQFPRLVRSRWCPSPHWRRRTRNRKEAERSAGSSVPNHGLASTARSIRPAAVPKLLMLLANPGPRLVGVVPFQMTALVPLAPVSEPATCPALLIARASLEDKGATATLRAEIANEGTGGSVAAPTLARSSQTLTAPAPYWRNHPGLNQSCADALCLELLATLSPGQ
jgi:hypothetical protein